MKSEVIFNIYVWFKMFWIENVWLVIGIVVNFSGVFVVGKLVKFDNIYFVVDKFIRYLIKFKNVCLIVYNGWCFDFFVFVLIFKNI